MQALSQEVARLQIQVSQNTNQRQIPPNDNTIQRANRGNEQIVPPVRSAPLPSPIHNQGATTQFEDLPQASQSIQSAPQNKPPITENQQRLSTNVQNIGSKLISKAPSRRAIIVLSILVVLIVVVASSGSFYVYQSHIAAKNATAVTATAATKPNQYPSYLPGHGTLALFDTLDGASNNYRWDTTTNGCKFSNGAYHVKSSSPNTIQNCVAASTNYTNFAFEVTMTINQGDCGGVTFRADSSTYNYYSFQLCTNGFYNILINPVYASNQQSLTYGKAGNIKQSSNLIDVLANGSHIAIYINKQLANSVADKTLSQGQIGFLAANIFSASTSDVSFTNAKVWTL